MQNGTDWKRYRKSTWLRNEYWNNWNWTKWKMKLILNEIFEYLKVETCKIWTKLEKKQVKNRPSIPEI